MVSKASRGCRGVARPQADGYTARENMRVLMLCALDVWALPGSGGAPSLYRTLRAYGERGHRVTFVAPTIGANAALPAGRLRGYKPTQPPAIDGVAFERFHLPSLQALPVPFPPRAAAIDQKLRFALLFPLLAAREAQRVLERDGVDLLYAYEVHGALAARRLRRRYRLPTVARFQGTVMYPALGSRLARLRRYEEVLALRLLADLFIMTDDGTRGDEVLARLNPPSKGRVRFWRNGLDLDRLRPASPSQRQAQRAILAIPDDAFVLLTASRLAIWKRVDRAVAALPEILRAVPDVLLLIVGDGEERSNLERLARELRVNDHVRFAGAVPQEQVAGYMHAADAFLALADLSNVGNPLLEAMACGLPPVALDAGDTRSLVREGETGRPLSYGEPGDIARTVAALAQDAVERQRLGEGSRRYAEAHFWTWEARLSAELEEVERLVARVATGVVGQPVAPAEPQALSPSGGLGFLGHVNAVFLTYVASAALAFGVGVLLARALGPGGRGVYALFLLSASITQGVLGLGMNVSAVYYLGKRQMPVVRVVANGMAVALLAGGVCSLFVLLSWPVLGDRFADHGIPYWTFAFVVPLFVSYGLLTSVLQGTGRFLAMNAVLLTQPIVQFSLLASGYALGHVDPTAAVLFWAGGTLGATLLALALLSPSLRPAPRWRADGSGLRDLARFGLRGQIGNVMQLLNYRLDQYIVLLFVNTAGVGIYAVAVSLTQSVWFVSNAVATVLLPRLAATDKADAARTTPLVCRTTLLVSALGAVALAVVSPAVLLLFGHDYRPSLAPLLWLLPGTVALAGSKILASYVFSQGYPGTNSLITVASLVVTLIADFALIPRFGVPGAAVASSLAYTTHFALSLVAYRRVSGGSILQAVLVRGEDLRRYLALAGFA